MCAYQEHVGRTAGEEKEESKETIGFVAGDSKGGQRPFWHWSKDIIS